MPLCEIIEHFDNADGWQVGDIVDITNAESLIAEGKVKLVKAKKEKANKADQAPVVEPAPVEVAPTEEVPVDALAAAVEGE